MKKHNELEREMPEEYENNRPGTILVCIMTIVVFFCVIFFVVALANALLTLILK